MNHLKSGKAIFGQGSYKNYKFSGKDFRRPDVRLRGQDVYAGP
ncbi:hypothetical protein [uncultured Chryseobacterium sp.]|nr:hypothetical protein [uncultured Chryseobacterium sp.]